MVRGGTQRVRSLCAASLSPTPVPLRTAHSHALLPARPHAQQFQCAGYRAAAGVIDSAGAGPRASDDAKRGDDDGGDGIRG